MKFKEYINDKFKLSGMNQEEFSKLIKVSRPTLSKYLTGDHSPTISKANDILKILGAELIVISR